MERYPDYSVDRSAPGTPLSLGEADRFLEQPRASFLESNTGNSVQSTPNNSSPLLASNKPESDHGLQQAKSGSGTKRGRLIILILVGLGVLAVIVLAVVLPVYFKVIKPRQNQDNLTSGSSASGSSAGSGSVGSGSGNPASPSGATSGGDGSEIIVDGGANFTYKNPFGGYCEFPEISTFSST